MIFFKLVNVCITLRHPLIRSKFVFNSLYVNPIKCTWLLLINEYSSLMNNFQNIGCTIFICSHFDRYALPLKLLWFIWNFLWMLFIPYNYLKNRLPTSMVALPNFKIRYTHGFSKFWFANFNILPWYITMRYHRT